MAQTVTGQPRKRSPFRRHAVPWSDKKKQTQGFKTPKKVSNCVCSWLPWMYVSESQLYLQKKRWHTNTRFIKLRTVEVKPKSRGCIKESFFSQDVGVCAILPIKPWHGIITAYLLLLLIASICHVLLPMNPHGRQILMEIILSTSHFKQRKTAGTMENPTGPIRSKVESNGLQVHVYYWPKWLEHAF